MSTHEYDISFDTVEHLHDLRLVWTPEVRPRLAAVEGDPRLLGNCAVRVLPGGASQSSRLRPVLRISAQDYSRSNYDLGVHCVRDFLSQREVRLELPRRVCLPGCRCILCLCIQDTRIRQLNAGSAMGIYRISTAPIYVGAKRLFHLAFPASP